MKMRGLARKPLAVCVCALLVSAIMVLVPSTPAMAEAYTWVTQHGGFGTYLYGVHGCDENHVWAVGTDGTCGFFDGTSWTAQSGLHTFSNYTDVYAADPSHVWAIDLLRVWRGLACWGWGS